ncbi:MAG: glutamate--tRNA ligase [Candidatus Anstonellales archaeon]
MREIIRKYVIRNALQYGRADEKSVMGKVMAEVPEARSRVQEVMELIKEEIKAIEGMGKEEMEKEIEGKEFIKAKEPDPFAVEGAEQGKVITRFPPEPNGYLHIGHCKALVINRIVADKYKGRMIIRIDDTNPAKESKEYLDAIVENIKWLGIKWDSFSFTTDYMNEIYEACRKLIQDGNAYVCTCAPEEVKKGRAEKKGCDHRNKRASQNLEEYEKLKINENGIVRLKGDMESENTVMRDPTLMRVVGASHFRHGRKYKLWPTYDLASALVDSIEGVTHAMRSKEYELREELYFTILRMLKMREPKLIHFSRLNMRGMPVSKRLIKPLVEQGKVSGWDDPRLPTLAALKRRGITPEALKSFASRFGLGKAENEADIEMLLSENKKVVDKTSPRFVAIENPKELEVGLSKTVQLKKHPTEDMGVRELCVNGRVLVEKAGEEMVLRNLGRFRISGKRAERIGEGEKGELWLPPEQAVEGELWEIGLLYEGDKFNEKSLVKKKAMIEAEVANQEKGKIIQLERKGFYIIDSLEPLVLIRSC